MKLITISLLLLIVLSDCLSKKHENPNFHKVVVHSINGNAVTIGVKQRISQIAEKKNYSSIVNKHSDTIIEGKILSRIRQLPEVRTKEAFIDSLTNHKKGISVIIFQRPSSEGSGYWIRVGFDGPIRFETYYDFYVDKKSLEIKIYDTVTGNIISLTDWRKKR